jgi:polyribonucleotide nucleotidyltransferase
MYCIYLYTCNGIVNDALEYGFIGVAIMLFGFSFKVAVPRAAVGVVIGKGGDMIKKIQNETGARVQFQQGRDDGPGERRCLLTGKPSQVDQARRRIEELIDSVLVSFFSSCIVKHFTVFRGFSVIREREKCSCFCMLSLHVQGSHVWLCKFP